MTPILLLAFISLSPAAVEQTVRFSTADVQVLPADGGVQVQLPDAELWSVPGRPALPCRALSIPLPQGMRASRLLVTKVEYEQLPGTHALLPVQPPTILSAEKPRRAAPDLAAFASTRYEPAAIAELTGQGLASGSPCASVVLHPVQYLPSEQRLRLATRIDLRVECEPALPAEPVRDSGPFEYLVVTGAGLDTAFADLADWKEAKGVRSAVRLMDWVRAGQPGRDDAERLRNYLKSCFADSGLKWVLLGGDVDVVPVRKAFAMACSARLHPREDSLPCDLYFSDLDGSWDEDGDNLFGEAADSVDLYPDVYVGRAPVSTPAQARAFVSKVLAYENSWYNDYQRNAVFTAFVLWEDPFTDEAVAKDLIDEQSVPPRFDPIRKLYHTRGFVHRDTVVAEMNRGFGLFNHCGHGWTDVMGLSGYEKLRNGDMDALTNSGRYGVGFSIGCWTTAFDLDAIAEHFVNSPGGGVAFIGNSSYGWGAPGNPGYGYSDRFDARFFDELFSTGEPHAGAVLAAAKSHFVPYSREANVYRWHQYCLNLIGDPEMPVHTDTLAPIHASLPLRLPIGNDRTRIAVWDNSGPIEDAAVCIRKGDELLVSGRTGPGGEVVLKAECLTAGAAQVVVTAANHRPLADTVPVNAGPHVALLDWQVLDDGNGVAGPGETVGLELTLANTGSDTATGLSAEIQTGSRLILLPWTQAPLPALAPGETLRGAPFSVIVDSTARSGQTALLELTVTDTFNTHWRSPLVLRVCEPGLSLLCARVLSDAPVSAGDTLLLRFALLNTGLAPLKGITGNLFRNDSLLTPLTPGLLFPDLAPGETGWSLTRSPVQVSPGARLPAVGKLGVNFSAPDVRGGDTVRLLLGPCGFDGDGFTHGGTPDLWHVEESLSGFEPVFHAGSVSGPYPPNCNSWLLSDSFVMPAGAELSFLRRFDVPIYGSDGLYVIVCTASGEDTLDFIGSGGALAPRSLDPSLPSGITSDWFEQSYDISSHPPAETAQVKFSFVSDDSAAGGGFFVFGVRVAPADVELPSTPPADSSALLTAFPNPFRRTTTVFYQAAGRGYWEVSASLRVYDRSGRLARTLVNQWSTPSRRAVTWDGTDDNGRLLPAGVYFLRLEVTGEDGEPELMPPSHIRRRIVLVR